MKFRDGRDGQYLSATVAKAIAIQRFERQGGDAAEMIGIIRRLDKEEEARELFFDITTIEVFI